MGVKAADTTCADVKNAMPIKAAWETGTGPEKSRIPFTR